MDQMQRIRQPSKCAPILVGRSNWCALVYRAVSKMVKRMRFVAPMSEKTMLISGMLMCSSKFWVASRGSDGGNEVLGSVE